MANCLCKNKQSETPAVDISLCHDSWLHTSHLRFETEVCLCAAQEQALATLYIDKKIWKEAGTCICRLCTQQDVTFHHIFISACSMLAPSKYKHRHDQIGIYLHWLTQKKYDIPVSDSWLNHKPLTSTTSGPVTANSHW